MWHAKHDWDYMSRTFDPNEKKYKSEDKESSVNAIPMVGDLIRERCDDFRDFNKD